MAWRQVGPGAAAPSAKAADPSAKAAPDTNANAMLHEQVERIRQQCEQIGEPFPTLPGTDEATPIRDGHVDRRERPRAQD